jgi:hypothetical protein
MFALSSLVLLFAALAATTPVQAADRLEARAQGGHGLTFVNNCPKTITPMITGGGTGFVELSPLAPGAAEMTVVPDNVRTSRSDVECDEVLAGECSGPLPVHSATTGLALTRTASSGTCTILRPQPRTNPCIQHALGV